VVAKIQSEELKGPFATEAVIGPMNCGSGFLGVSEQYQSKLFKGPKDGEGLWRTVD